MAAVGIALRPGNRKDGKDVICARITHRGTTRYLSTGIYVKSKRWNKNQKRVRKTHPDHLGLNEHLSGLETEAQSAANAVITGQEGTTADRIKESLQDRLNEGTSSEEDFLAFVEEFLEGYKRRGQVGTHKAYRSVFNKFCRFLEEKRHRSALPFDAIDVPLVKGFRDYMHEIGNSQNTVAKGLRTVRTFLYAAMDEGKVSRDRNPFEHVDIREEKTQKDVLTIDEIQEIEALDLDPSNLVWHVRNWFLFSFYAGGLRFSDIALMRHENVRREGEKWTLHYSTSKTSRPDVMPLVPPAIEILGHYYEEEASGDELLFNVLDGYDLGTEADRRSAIESRNAYANEKLRLIKKRADLDTHISFHVARHSIAFHMRRKGLSSAQIKEVLGHSSLQITEAYLGTLPEDHKREMMEGLF